jgi:hypothetical protein
MFPALFTRSLAFMAGIHFGLAATAAADPRSGDWYYNPFSKDSAHHRPIGTGAIYSADDNPATICFQQGTAFNINVGSRPLFYKYLRMVVNSVPEGGKVKFNGGDSRTAPTGGPNRQLVVGAFPAGGGRPLAPNTAIVTETSR